MTRLAAAVACALAGCSVGVNASMLGQGYRGAVRFEGADVEVTDPVTAGLHAGPETWLAGGPRLVPELFAGLNLPWLRAGGLVALGLDDGVTVAGGELLAKVPVAEDDGTHVRLLAGGTVLWLQVSRGVRADVSVPGYSLQAGDALIRDGDDLLYEASFARTAGYLTLGVEVDVDEWLQLHGAVLVRVAEDTSHDRRLIVEARSAKAGNDGKRSDEEVDVLSQDDWTVSDALLGGLDTDLPAPFVLARIGVAFTLPTARVLRFFKTKQ